MIAVRKFAYVVALGVLFSAPAVARVPFIPVTSLPEVPFSVTYVQQQELPEIVQLLVDRAQRAERRGDTATAAELYDAIRDLGYVVVNRPRSGSNAGQGEAPERPRRWWQGGGDNDDRARNGDGDYDEDGDDGDSWDDGDDGDDGDGDGDGWDGDGGESDGDGDSGDGDGGDGEGEGEGGDD